MSAPLLLSTGLTSALSGGPGEHDHAPHDGPLAGEQFDETNPLLPSASAVIPPLPYQATLQNARLLMRMTPLPVMQLACLCALHFVEPMVMGQISPSVNAMLADLRPVLPEVGKTCLRPLDRSAGSSTAHSRRCSCSRSISWSGSLVSTHLPRRPLETRRTSEAPLRHGQIK